MAKTATEFIDATTAAAFIPELWSSLAIVQREAQLVFAPLVDRRFESELTFGDILHVPTVTNLTATQKGANLSANAAVTYETQTENVRDITVDQWYYAAIAIESANKVQTNRDQLALYSGKLGYALALNVDDVLAGLIDDETTNTVGTLAVENDDDELLRAIQYLDDENVPGDGRAFAFSPAGAIGLLKLDRFVHNDYSMLHGSTAPVTALEKAYVTSFYGTPIYKSTNVEGTNAAGHDNALFHKEYMALVMQMSPTTHMQFDIDYIVDKVVMEQLYGTQTMRINTNSVEGRYCVWIQGA